MAEIETSPPQARGDEGWQQTHQAVNLPIMHPQNYQRKALAYYRVDACLMVDIAQIARGEAAENFDRKDFTHSEAVSIKRELEPEIREAAQERMKNGKPSGKLPEGAKGESREKIAAFTGFSARSLDKADAIVTAAEAEPEKFGKLRADMDRTGRVDGPEAAALEWEILKAAEAGEHKMLWDFADQVLHG